jgi:hypothetical protein
MTPLSSLVLIAAAASSINDAMPKAGADQSVKPREQQSDTPTSSPMASANNPNFRGAFVHVGRGEGGKFKRPKVSHQNRGKS